jgi:hypothetical protein
MSGATGSAKGGSKPEPDVLFQSYFKSVGPRTYAAQVKRAGNGNHFLVLTEGKRDEKTDEVRKTRLFVFSEDFPAFFRLVQEAAVFIRANPVPEEVKQNRDRFWSKQKQPGKNAGPRSEPTKAAAVSPGAVSKPAVPPAKAATARV